MNWSRGFFRLWLVAAVLWTAFVLTVSWLDTPEPVSRLTSYCRYNAIVALDLDDDKVVQALLETAKQEQSGPACQYHVSPHATTNAAGSPLLTDDEVAAALATFRKDQAEHPARVRMIWQGAIGFAAIPIAIVFAIGWLVLWALSGFRSHRP